jgi:hypothetical protein
MKIFRKLLTFLAGLTTYTDRDTQKYPIPPVRRGPKIDYSPEAVKARYIDLLRKRDGVREFVIDGMTVIARNRKNARRKANNLLKQGQKENRKQVA